MDFEKKENSQSRASTVRTPEYRSIVVVLIAVVTLSSWATVMIAGTAPLAITINNPGENATVPAWSPVQVSASITGGTAPTQLVLLWTKNGVTTSMPCPSSTPNWNSVAWGSGCVWTVNTDTGDRTIQAQATDATGSVATSAPRTFHLGTVPLAITISSPTDNATVPAWSPVQVSASTTGGTAPTQLVLLWTKNGVTTSMPCPSSTPNWNSVVSGSGCVWTVNADMGDRTIQAQATDATGSVATSAVRTFHLGTTTPPPPSTSAFRGVNLITLCDNRASLQHYPADMLTKQAADLDYYNAKGFKLLRVLLAWESLQPTLYGPLYAPQVQCLKDLLRLAKDREMKAALDVHNYDRYVVENDNGNKSVFPGVNNGYLIGSVDVPTSAFADLWRKLAGELNGSAALYDIMNEPFNTNGTWLTSAQAAVDAIRAVDNSTTIIVEGDNWANCASWPTTNGGLENLRDPASNILLSCHVYFDNGSGQYIGPYGDTQPSIGIDRTRPFIEWLMQHQLKGYVGEYGIPSRAYDDTRWLTVLDNFLAYLDEHCIAGTYFWGGYILNTYWNLQNHVLNIAPLDGQDHPPMSILQKHATASCREIGP
jgi:endoglucanase